MRHAEIASKRGTAYLTPAEESDAWARGDHDRIITAHLHLGRRIAEQFARRWGLDADDLASEAYIGLVRAARKYDPSRGVRYSSYCQLWIRAQIWRYIMANWRAVKVGTSHLQRQLFFGLCREFRALEEVGGDTSTEALAERFGCPAEEIAIMQRALLGDVPLDAQAGDGVTVSDIIALSDPAADAATDDAVDAELAERLRGLVAAFIRDRSQGDRRWADIIWYRILADDPATLQNIGDMSNVTRERIRQIEKTIYRELKAYIEEKSPDMVELFRTRQNMVSKEKFNDAPSGRGLDKQPGLG